MINAIAKKLNRKNKKGFTLIELIVVIAIVAVLAAVGIPAIAGQVSKSKQSTAEANAKLLATQASIMLTNAEAAGDYTDVKDMSGTSIATPPGTSNSKSSDFTEAVAEAANVDITKSSIGAVDIALAEIYAEDGSTQIGWRVSSVTFEDGSITGTFPIAGTASTTSTP